MKKTTLVVGLLALMGLVLVAVAVAAKSFDRVKPREFDPAKTFLVQAEWLSGIGCPTNAATSSDGQNQTGTYTDPACPAATSPRDRKVEGLLLAKTGPTANFAAAVADLKHVPKTVTQLGYDIRKEGGSLTPLGSHCGAGAPRFNVTTSTGTQFIGCNSPPATSQVLGNGWTRLTWTVAYTNVERIAIVFDEGQDTGPDFFGLAVLDNINVNGDRVGSSGGSDDDDDDEDDDD
jgi:hypothetical protein